MALELICSIAKLVPVVYEKMGREGRSRQGAKTHLDSRLATHCTDAWVTPVPPRHCKEGDRKIEGKCYFWIKKLRKNIYRAVSCRISRKISWLHFSIKFFFSIIWSKVFSSYLILNISIANFTMHVRKIQTCICAITIQMDRKSDEKLLRKLCSLVLPEILTRHRVDLHQPLI